jgi:hypothetical protein
VRELTKKVGQVSRTGKITDIRGEFFEVLWDDGHTGLLSGGVLVAENHEAGKHDAPKR